MYDGEPVRFGAHDDRWFRRAALRMRDWQGSCSPAHTESRVPSARRRHRSIGEDPFELRAGDSAGSADRDGSNLAGSDQPIELCSTDVEGICRGLRLVGQPLKGFGGLQLAQDATPLSVSALRLISAATSRRAPASRCGETARTRADQRADRTGRLPISISFTPPAELQWYGCGGTSRPPTSVPPLKRTSPRRLPGLTMWAAACVPDSTSNGSSRAPTRLATPTRFSRATRQDVECRIAALGHVSRRILV